MGVVICTSCNLDRGADTFNALRYETLAAGERPQYKPICVTCASGWLASTIAKRGFVDRWSIDSLRNGLRLQAQRAAAETQRSVTQERNARVEHALRTLRESLHTAINRAQRQAILDAFNAACEGFDLERELDSERQFGISHREYFAQLARQRGRCAICRREARLVMDHDHETGVFRGLLCNQCNLGLGALGDSETSLRAALAYLMYGVSACDGEKFST